MLQYVHIGDEGPRVVELGQSFPPSAPLEETDIAYRGLSGFSIHGNSGNRKTRHCQVEAKSGRLREMTAWV
jgi:hypothetical protein